MAGTTRPFDRTDLDFCSFDLGAGERQLGLEDLLLDLGDVVYFVDPDVTAGAGGLEAVGAAPVHEVVVDGRVDAAGLAVAHGGRRLDRGQDQVLRGRRELGRPLGHGQRQVDRGFIAVDVCEEDHERPRYLGQPGDVELVEQRSRTVDDGNRVLGADAGCGAADGYHAHRRNLLHCDVVRWHGVFSFDVAEPGLDSAQPGDVLV